MLFKLANQYPDWMFTVSSNRSVWEKQNWVILFSEEDAFLQNAKIIPQIANRGIYSIPSNSNLIGTYKLIRTK